MTGNLIRFKSIDLPRRLFYFSSDTTDMISPAAHFDPVSALENGPWQSATPPAAEPQTKSLVITQSYFDSAIEKLDLIALAGFLHHKGFKIYICFYSVIESYPLLIMSWIAGSGNLGVLELAHFDENRGYTLLANQHQEAYDKIIILDEEKTAELVTLTTTIWHATLFPYQIKDCISDTQEIKSPQDLLNKLHTHPEQAPELIEKYSEKIDKKHIRKFVLEFPQHTLLLAEALYRSHKFKFQLHPFLAIDNKLYAEYKLEL